MKTTLLILGALVALGSPFCPAADLPPTSPPSPKTIAMIGDSITHNGDWEKVLGRKEVLNWGISGYTTGQLAWTFKDVLREHPGVKIVFLGGGINDLTLGVSADRVIENQIKAVAWWREHGVVAVIESVILKTEEPDTNATITGLNARLRAHCESHSIEYLDLNAVLAVDGHLRKEFSTDGTHLQPAAYPLWANLVNQELVRLEHSK